MQEVVRLADRFMDPRNPRSIEQEGKLSVIVLFVALTHGAVAASLFGMSAWEKGLGRAHTYSTVVSIELAKTVMPKNAETDARVNIRATPKTFPKIFKDYLSSIIEKQPTAQIQSKPNAQAALRLPLTPKQSLPSNDSKSRSNQERSLASKSHELMPDSSANEATGTPEAAFASHLSESRTTAQATANKESAGSQDSANQPSMPVNPGGEEIDSKSRRSFALNQQNRASGLIASLPPGGGARLMGNIGPYRKNLLNRIGRNWHPTELSSNITLLITLDRDGNLLESEILESSGSKKVDREAIVAVKNTEFAPLPEWFKGEQLKFRVELTSAETSNGRI